VRVLFNLLDANVGGGQRIAAGIAEALRAQGHAIGVAAPTDGPALRWFTRIGADTHFVDLSSLRRPWTIRRATAAFTGYDLVYSHTSVPGMILAGEAASRAGRPHVIHQHIYPDFSNSEMLRAAQRKLFARETARSEMVAVAQHVADAAIAAGAPRRNITVIPNGVEIPKDDPIWRIGEPIKVGLLGRLDVSKGIDIFLDAVALMHTTPKVALGTPTPASDLGRQLHERARSLSVEVVAPASQDFLSTLDIVAVPSRFEGHPLTLLEAMALGKPVVASAIPGVVEMLEGEDAGLLVPSQDASALAAALDRLATDDELRRHLGARARSLVSTRYALPVVHARVIELLKRVASGRPASA
jgi:glycosyltransferase involved in cell wall biosynthesis